jgi:hypothetical protein
MGPDPPPGDRLRGDLPPGNRPDSDLPVGPLTAGETDEQRGTALVDELRVLGRTIHTLAPDGDALVAAVVERVEGDPAPGSPRGRLWAWTTAWIESIRAVLREPRRVAVVAATALVVTLALTPPVRATVADWLGLGVVVRPGPSVPSGTPPAAAGSLTLKEAARLVQFTPVVPRALGTPDNVDVASDGRLLSLSWTTAGGTRRLDEFEGRLAPLFVKTVGREGGAEYVDLDGRLALWFPRPHEVALVDATGAEHTESARPAGPTLVWESSGVTLRLEGVADKERAIEIARSTP